MSQTYTPTDSASSVISTTEAMHTLPKPKYSQEVDKLVNGVNNVGGMHKTLPVDIVRHIQHFAFLGLPDAARLEIGCSVTKQELAEIIVYKNTPLLSKALRPEMYQAHAYCYLLMGRFSRIAAELESCVKNNTQTLCPAMQNAARIAQGYKIHQNHEMLLFNKDLLDQFKTIDEIVNFGSPKALEELAKLKEVEKYKAEKRQERLVELYFHPLHTTLFRKLTEMSDLVGIVNHIKGGRKVQEPTEAFRQYCENRDLTSYPEIDTNLIRQFFKTKLGPMNTSILVRNQDEFDDFGGESMLEMRKVAPGEEECETYRENFSIQINCDRRIAFLNIFHKFHKEVIKTGMMTQDNQSYFATRIYETLAYALLDPRANTKHLDYSISNLVREVSENANVICLSHSLSIFRKCNFYTEKMLDLFCRELLKHSQIGVEDQVILIKIMSHAEQKQVVNKNLFTKLCLQSTFVISRDSDLITLGYIKGAEKMTEVVAENPLLSELFEDPEIKTIIKIVKSALNLRDNKIGLNREYIKSLSPEIMNLIFLYCVW